MQNQTGFCEDRDHGDQAKCADFDQVKRGLAKILAHWVCVLRTASRLTQEELAKRSGLSIAFIRRIERGELKNPSLERLEKLAVGLDAEVADLFRVDEKIDVTSYDKAMLIEHLARVLRLHGLAEIRAVQTILREVFAIQRLGRK